MALQLFKIASTTVETPQANIEFTSIPSGYTDLILKISIRTSKATVWDEMDLTFNGTSTGYYDRHLAGDGSAASSSSNSNAAFFRLVMVNGNTATTNSYGNGDIYIPNYTSSNYKSFSAELVSENNATNAYQYLYGGVLQNTAAITSIKLTSHNSASILAGSTATLYGVL